MVDLHYERDLVGIPAGAGSQHSERGGHGIALALDRQFDDVGCIEVDGIGGEASAGGMFDSLVDREDRQIAGASKPAVAEHCLQIAKDYRRPVAVHPYAVDKIWTWKVQEIL